jgi:hypothetical protein
LLRKNVISEKEFLIFLKQIEEIIPVNLAKQCAGQQTTYGLASFAIFFLLLERVNTL